jgi:hypothetical protein
MIFSSSPPRMKMLEGPALSGPRSRQSATLHQDMHFHESFRMSFQRVDMGSLNRSWFLSLVALFLLLVNLQGAVTRVEVKSRTDLLGREAFGSAGAYEKVIGIVHFAVDPRNAHNQVITDLDKAPVNSKGLVEFSADLYILRPKDPRRGNGTVLFEVCNRGHKGLLPFFNRAQGSPDPKTEAEIGDGFLLRHGFALVWVGWQFDVPRQEGLMRLHAPVASNKGQPITGWVRSDFVLPQRTFDFSLADRNHIAYPALDPDSPMNTLTVRDSVLGARKQIPRAEWLFARAEAGRPVPDATRAYLKEGFEPGKIYEVVYRARNPVVVGLGLAAVRDLIAYFRHDPQSVLPARYAYAFGISQSARFLRHFLYQGFNADEGGQNVFDAVLCHVAGGGRGSFNHRFAQPSRDAHPFSAFFYPTDIFPFADNELVDPETGDRDGLLTHILSPAVLPKIFYTNSSYEYWGRAASLIHTTLDGKSDLPLMENVRIYFFAGSQHGPGRFPPELHPDMNYLGQQKTNPNDYKWSMRALLLAMDRWVKSGTLPPASRFPRIADKTLVPLTELAFPSLPGLRLPRQLHKAYRVDYGPDFKKGIIDYEPPRIGHPYVMLVPQVNRDGNELAGILLPEIAVPLATYTGWNLRDPHIGAAEELAGMVGSYLPFPQTRDQRIRLADPRASIEERYPNKARYVSLFTDAVMGLMKDGFLLPEDLPPLLDRAREHWDYATGNCQNCPKPTH